MTAVPVGLVLDSSGFVTDLVNLYKGIIDGTTPEGGFPKASIFAEWAKNNPGNLKQAIQN
jgi:hypothetical protein